MPTQRHRSASLAQLPFQVLPLSGHPQDDAGHQTTEQLLHHWSRSMNCQLGGLCPSLLPTVQYHLSKVHQQLSNFEVVRRQSVGRLVSWISKLIGIQSTKDQIGSHYKVLSCILTKLGDLNVTHPGCTDVIHGLQVTSKWVFSILFF